MVQYQTFTIHTQQKSRSVMKGIIMQKMSLKLPAILSKIFLFIHLSNFTSFSVAAASNDTDRLALLAFKNTIIEDPMEIMHSWNDSIHLCSWPGVVCNNRHARRVTALNLPGMKLTGGLPPHIGNLSFLRVINLTDNNFRGEIPQEIGRLSLLRYLELFNNAFEGKIPSNLSNCSDLQEIRLTSNHLDRDIPLELSSLATKKLKAFQLTANNLTGIIPLWLGNATSLELLAMGRNNFHGSIPSELGRLSKLVFLQIGMNHLSGTIPPSIYNLSLLYEFGVTANQLQGKIAPDICFRLPNLQGLYMALNHFTGPMPVSFSNASRLEDLSFAANELTGTVPPNLGSLKSLRHLTIGLNQLHGISFLTSLTNCSNLQLLDIGHNRFTGQLPASISNFSSTLQQFLAGKNQISGTIPDGIGELVGLTRLEISMNPVIGKIPTGISKLQSLEELSLFETTISGVIPSSLGNVTRLRQLYLHTNYLDGNIPSSLGNCQQLERLELFRNNLTSTIPIELASLSSLTLNFDLSQNSLTGPLPPEIGNMSKLVEFDVSDNKLSGEIPTTISDCLMMERLSIAGNLIEGSIPFTLSRLTSLQVLNLSRNNISGKFPTYLQNFTYLKNLDLSFNNLEGEVPREGVFRNTSEFSIIGNFKLCGGSESLGLSPCQNRVRNKHTVSVAVTVALPIAITCLVLLAFVCFTLWRKKKSRSSTMLHYGQQFPNVTYLELSRATNKFSSSNLIGRGSNGFVYKGTLGRDELIVAVKVLNLKQKGAAKSFMAECNALRNIRHRNLVKVITTCSGIDSRGDDFKALVYEFMPNGSLADFVHRNEDEQLKEVTFNFTSRLNIVIDVASALAYLHHHCQTTIIHGDLKPSNVLLDYDMMAHVGDFGLARFLYDSVHDDSSSYQSKTSGIRGTIGYIPPEYGMGGRASMQGDVYSFGILVLEVFTGKKPTDDIFMDVININLYTKNALLNNKVTEIVDSSLLLEIGTEGVGVKNVEGCLAAVLEIGVSCSMEFPGERMDIRNVVAELCKIKENFHGIRD